MTIERLVYSFAFHLQRVIIISVVILAAFIYFEI